jgi:hypothetical protein
MWDSEWRMSRECEITKESDLVGLIVLDGGIVSAKAAKGYDVLMRSILDEPVFVDDKTIYRRKDPVAWFEGLPRQYHGSRVWASIREIGSSREGADKFIAVKE